MLPSSNTNNGSQNKTSTSGNACIFVANLPQGMSNFHLAYALLDTFSTIISVVCPTNATLNATSSANNSNYCGNNEGFPSVKAIKASRDGAQRPFGFLELDSAETAARIMDYARRKPIWLAGRRLRVELAKQQWRYRILTTTDAGNNQSDQNNAVGSNDDGEWVIRQALPNLPGDALRRAGPRNFVLRVDCEPLSEALQAEWSKSLGWQISSLGGIGQTSAASSDSYLNTRSSGLVHLAVPPRPHQLLNHPHQPINYHQFQHPGLFMPPPFIHPIPPFNLPPPPPHHFMCNSAINNNSNNTAFFGHQQPTLQQHQNSQTNHINQTINGNSGSSLVVAPCEELHLPSSDVPNNAGATKEKPHGMHPGDIYVGRLNSQSVTLEALQSKFEPYGPIAYIRLHNRLARSVADGVPIDAWALIRFVRGAEDASRAISCEHQVIWHGQAMKCEKARPAPSANNHSGNNSSNNMNGNQGSINDN